MNKKIIKKKIIKYLVQCPRCGSRTPNPHGECYCSFSEKFWKHETKLAEEFVDNLEKLNIKS